MLESHHCLPYIAAVVSRPLGTIDYAFVTSRCNNYRSGKDVAISSGVRVTLCKGCELLALATTFWLVGWGRAGFSKLLVCSYGALVPHKLKHSQTFDRRWNERRREARHWLKYARSTFPLVGFIVSQGFCGGFTACPPSTRPFHTFCVSTIHLRGRLVIASNNTEVSIQSLFT